MDSIVDLIRMQLMSNQNAIVSNGRLVWKNLLLFYLLSNHKVLTEKLQTGIVKFITSLSVVKKVLNFEKKPKSVVFLQMENGKNQLLKEILNVHAYDFGEVRMKDEHSLFAKNSNGIVVKIAADVYMHLYFEKPPEPSTDALSKSAKSSQSTSSSKDSAPIVSPKPEDEFENARARVFSYQMSVKELVSFLQRTYKIEKEQPVEQQLIEKKMPNLSQLTVACLTSIEDDLFKGDTQDFVISKNLHNIFLEEHIRERLVSHMKRFEDRVWYAERGIPRTLGILLHGEPGCGKTSFIKAICADQKRTALIIDFKMIKTVKHLRHIFRGHMETKNGNSFQFDKQKVIYVFEDFDCMCDIFMDRDLKEEQQTTEKEEQLQWYKDAVLYKKRLRSLRRKSKSGKTNEMGDTSDSEIEWGMQHKKLSKITSGDEKITLGDFLELMDGIIEMDGRIIIMTTNHRDKIDKALLRPGRIDLDLELSPPSRELVCEIFFYMYQHLETDVLESLWRYYHSRMPDKTVSTAKVMNLFTYMDPKFGLEALCLKEATMIVPEDEIDALVQRSKLRVAERIKSGQIYDGDGIQNEEKLIDLYTRVVVEKHFAIPAFASSLMSGFTTILTPNNKIRLQNLWHTASSLKYYWVEFDLQHCPFVPKEVTLNCLEFSPKQLNVKGRFEDGWLRLVNRTEDKYRKDIVCKIDGHVKVDMIRIDFCGCFKREGTELDVTNIDIGLIKIRGIFD